MTRHRPIPHCLRIGIVLCAASACPGSTVLAQESSSAVPGTPSAAVAGSPAGQTDQAHRSPGLIPAAFGIRTDRAGNSWSVERDGNIGRIGSTMVNSGLGLTVNDEKFSGFQPMMTADGSEFVLQGAPFASLPGLQVQRRVL